MIKLSFSSHLSTLLCKEDIIAITLYIEQNYGYGYSLFDRIFPIRKTNGLVSYERIDVYVSANSMIFLSAIHTAKMKMPISISLDIDLNKGGTK